jgi:hypothetical protein
MSNVHLFLVNLVMAYAAVAGFFFVCFTVARSYGKTEATVKHATVRSVGWLWFIGRNAYLKRQTALQLALMRKAIKDDMIVKQFCIRHGRLVALAKDNSDLQDGDVIYQFHHNVWKHGFQIMEGWALDGRVSWVCGHIEEWELDEEIVVWSKLTLPVRNWLQNKS